VRERVLRWLLVGGRLALSMGLVAGIGALAHLPLGEPSSAAALRVALRTQRARVELCHDRTDAELAALPAHMRQRRICEETAADYHLVVRVDGVGRLDRRITHSGIRHNRPLVVDALLEVTPGEHDVEIRFAPELANAAAGAGELASYRLADRVAFPPGRIRIASLRDEKLAWLADLAAPR